MLRVYRNVHALVRLPISLSRAVEKLVSSVRMQAFDKDASGTPENCIQFTNKSQTRRVSSHCPLEKIENSSYKIWVQNAQWPRQGKRASFDLHPRPLTAMLHRFEAENPTQFDAVFSTASELASRLSAPFFVHVRGSWCPDCRRTDPAIQAAFEALANPAVVLTLQVPDMIAYRSPSFLYRTSPVLRLTAIPTIIRIRDGATSRLVEGECYDQEKINSVIRD